MNTKNIVSLITVLALLLIILIPFTVNAWSIGDPIVPQTCGQGVPKYDNKGECESNCPCGITDFFTLLSNIYGFIVLEIATPLAILALTIGGILILISAGNPNLLGNGKKIIYSAIIGIVLAYGSWLIIDFILKAIGFTGNWNSI